MSAERATETDAPSGIRRLWERVADAVAAEIEHLEPGARLPSEAEQRARFGVSRVTLRQALSHLQSQGKVEPKPGLGWFTADASTPRQAAQPRAVFEPPGKLMSFTDLARSRGLVPDSVVLERSVHGATVTEAEAFAIAPGAQVMRLQRLRRLDGLSVAVDTSLVPLAVLPTSMTTDFSTTSLHACFRAAGAAPELVDTEIEAIVADEARARLLEVPEGFPLLSVHQIFYDARHRVIERAVIAYRADRYRYRARQSA